MREEAGGCCCTSAAQRTRECLSGRGPSREAGDISAIRAQGAVCCFQTLLWPHSQPWPPLSCCPLAHPPPNALRLWVPAQGVIKGASPSMPSPPPGPVLGCSPGLSRQRLPTVCTHSGPGGLAEMGIRSLHCPRVTCLQCSLPGLGTEIHVKMSKAAESREGAWSLPPSGSRASWGHLQTCVAWWAAQQEGRVPLNKRKMPAPSLLTAPPPASHTHHAHTSAHPCTQTQHAHVHV